MGVRTITDEQKESGNRLTYGRWGGIKPVFHLSNEVNKPS